jgi:4-hydroxybenzoyl-CoA reductase subunit beta
MLRLPRFAVEVPDSIAAATAALATPGARVIAGGTDILPNLKHRLDAPPLLVSLARLDELRGIRLESATLVLGAGVTLAEIAESPLVGEHAPSLARAAGLIASPLIRNMGTLGGNINLDTRCRYVNQTDFWRSAIGGCLKSEGEVCHVVPKGKSCVAAMSADCVPVLCTLDADLIQVSAAGERRVAIADHYKSDGVDHITAPAGELTSAVRVPLAPGRRQAAYAKWAVRESIDFPLVSVAMRFDLDRGGVIEAASVVLGVMAARPKPVKVESLVGRRLEDASTLESLVEQLRKQARPLGNVPYDADYRRRVIPVFARRALEAALRG